MKLLRGWEFDELEEKSEETEKRNSYRVDLLFDIGRIKIKRKGIMT